MKKFFAIIMTFVMAFILVGCKKTPELSFEETAYSMKVGESETLKPTILNLENGEDFVEYKVNGAAIKIEGNKVTALKEGEATVTVSLKDYEKVPTVTLTFTVSKVAVTEVTVAGEKQVRKGETIKLTAVVKPETATYKEVTWTTSNAKVATVAKDGTVKGVEVGTAKITATADGVKKEFEVKVLSPLATAVTVKGEATMIKGATQKLEVALTPADAEKTFKFETSDAKVATVAEDGTVTAVNPGEATITVKAGKVEAKLVIAVSYAAVEKVEIAGAKELKPAETVALTATVTPATADPKVTWSTSDEEVATVAEDGKVTAVKPGKATITATAGEKTATVEIKVNFADAEKVEIAGETTVEQGGKIKLTSKVTPVLANPVVKWESDKAEVATVTETGLVKAVGVGEANIKATTADGKAATVKVTVTLNTHNILVDATYTAETTFEGKITRKFGENAFASIKDALAKAPEGATITVAKGTYADALEIAKSVTINGANADVNPNRAKREEETIVTEVVTIKANDVKLNGLAFTGKGQIVTDQNPHKNIELVNLYAYDKGEATSTWAASRSDYNNTGFITLISKDNGNLTGNIVIANNKFDLRDEAIKLGRVENLTVEGNAFLNFERDAVKFSGGFNGGYANFINNQFVNDTLKGYNAIFLACYGDASSKAPISVTLRGNVFKNIGNKDQQYSGIISSMAYQEKGAQFVVEDNVIENVTRGFNVRSNATAANHEGFPWTFVARHNKFVGVPEVWYFNCRFTAGDTDETAPKKAIFDQNLFLDNEGKVIEPDAAKMLNIKEVTNSYKSVYEYETEMKGLENIKLVVNGNWATEAAGTKVTVFGKEFTVGTDAFGTIAAAVAAAKANDVIYVAPGAYAEDVTADKPLTIMGNPYGKEMAVLTGKLTITSNTTVKQMKFTGKGQIVVADEKGVENVVFVGNVFDHPVSSDDGSQGYIYIANVAKNFVFNDNTIIYPNAARVIRFAKNITNLTMDNNYLDGSYHVYDYIRADKALGGNVVITNNYMNYTNQSGFMIMNHMPGNFLFMNNEFIDIKNVAIDIRSLVNGGETPKATLDILNNVFDRSAFSAGPWGAIRIRFKGYEEHNIKVNLHYNTFINWGTVDVVEDAGGSKYLKPLVEADYNYFEGVTSEDIHIYQDDILGGIGMSWDNTYNNAEALEGLNEGILLNGKVYAKMADALAAAKEGDEILMNNVTINEDINVAVKNITFIGNHATITGKVTAVSGTAFYNVTFTGVGGFEFTDEKVVENISMVGCQFINCKTKNDGLIEFKVDAKNVVFNHNTLVKPNNVRIIRGYGDIIDLEMIDNDLEGSTTAVCDYVRTDKAIGGEVVITDNKIGASFQSTFRFQAHKPGNFLFKDNVFDSPKNACIDFRSLVAGTEITKTTFNVIHNTFNREGWKAEDVWGCIRIRFGGYTAEQVEVNVNYNTFVGWGEENIVENCGTPLFDGQLVNADNNYYEGVTAATIDAKATKLFCEFGKTWANTFDSIEALETAYNA